MALAKGSTRLRVTATALEGMTISELRWVLDGRDVPASDPASEVIELDVSPERHVVGFWVLGRERNQGGSTPSRILSEGAIDVADGETAELEISVLLSAEDDQRIVRALGPLAVDSFRTYAMSDGGDSFKDLPTFDEARAYADDVASEGDHPEAQAFVFDPRWRLVYLGRHYAWRATPSGVR